MTRHPDKRDPSATRLRHAAGLSRRARLHAMLFAGAALGTTLLAVLGEPSGKLPPFRSE